MEGEIGKRREREKKRERERERERERQSDRAREMKKGKFPGNTGHLYSMFVCVLSHGHRRWMSESNNTMYRCIMSLSQAVR